MRVTQNSGRWIVRSKTAVKERNTHAVAPVEAGACRHHWIIETPRGALSDGRCKICGEERQFRNSTSDYIWDDDSSSGYGALSKMRPVVKVADDDSEFVAAPRPGRGEAALAV